MKDKVGVSHRAQSPEHLGRAMGAVGIALFGVYLLTMSTGVYPGLSAGWVAVAHGFSPAETSAHPLWRLFFSFWQQLPVGSPVWRLNLSSAVFGAIAAALLCRYVACWVYLRIQTLAEASSLSPSEKTDHTADAQKASVVAILSGVVAAILFGTSFAGWSAATRFRSEAFDLTLVLAALLLYQAATRVRGSWRLFALALLCGAGIAESVLFWMVVPFLIGAVLVFLYQRHRLRLGLCVGLLATGLLGLSVYIVSSYAFARTIPEAAGNAIPAWHMALRQVLQLNLKEAGFFLPQTGWPFVLLLLTLPWLAFQMGYWERLHRVRDFRADVLLVVCLVVVFLLQFNAPIPPWPAWRWSDRLPVVEAMIAAMLGGWAFAYWAYGVLFRWEPFKLVAGKERLRLEKRIRQKRWLAIGVCATTLMLGLAAAMGNGWEAAGRSGRFADQYAHALLAQMDGRTWLVTDGTLDVHLKARAAAERQTLHVMSLAEDHAPGQVRQLRQWIAEEPRMQAYRDRLYNAASLGVGAFVREWLSVDPEAEKALALYSVPDLWTAAGLVSRPDRLLFFAKRSTDELKALPLLEEQRAFWAHMRTLLPPVEEMREPADRLRMALRHHLSVVANDLGVLLMDLARNKEASEAFGESLYWNSQNLSALANRALLASKGIGPEKKERAEAAFKKAVAAFTHKPTIADVVRLYGQLRTPAALFDVGAAWAQRGQYSLAQGGLRRAAALEEDGVRRDVILGYLGDVSVHAGETGQGEEIFKNLLKKDPRNRVALMGMLNLALLHGNTNAAATWLAQARSAGANEASLVLAEARMDLIQRDFEAARERLLNLTDTLPKNLDAWTLLATVLIHMKRLEDVAYQVLPKMAAAVNMQPNTQVYQVRGDLARARGPAAYIEARQEYRRALKLSPGRYDLLETLVDLDLRLNDSAAAKQDAAELLRVDPGNANGHFVLGNQAVIRGELDAAESHFRTCVARAATPQALNNLAEVLLRKNALEDAEDTARQALSKANRNADVFDTLAAILLKRGKTDEALKIIVQARVIAPDNWSFAFTEARILMAANRKEEARVLLNAVENHAHTLPPYLRDEVTHLAQAWRTQR